MTRILKRGAFAFLFLLLLGHMNDVLIPKFLLRNSRWPTTTTINEFYQMDRDSIDVLFFGPSTAVNDFCPQVLYDEYGITSYNLSSEQQSIFLSYYWLKEALRTQKPKAAVLNMRFLFPMHDTPINTTEGFTRKCMDLMKWSSVKQEAVTELCELDDSQSLISYYLPFIRFHSRWTGLTELDFLFSETQETGLKGFGPLHHLGAEEYASFTPSGDVEAMREPQAIMLAYLDKTVELCKENGIALILVSLPDDAMDDGICNTLTSYAQEKDVDYYNFCETEMYESIGAVLPKESVIGHGNFWGAVKMSRTIGKMLSEDYGIAKRESAQFEETRGTYEHIKNNCDLAYETDIDKYLERINDERYTVFLSVKDEASSGLTDSIANKLHALGLQEDLRGKTRWSYGAIISPEEGVTEQLSGNESVSITGSIRHYRTSFSISSAGYSVGNASSIKIDGTEYSVNGRGLNIVVYDNDLMTVVDSVCFDTYGDCRAMRK